ncbi:hypothetical protein ACE38V_17305 [Cytobacillus sp. Hz8]|uniref:hypothetical protein n=1 Tax=Cytobacillus sp. Hz8 TaxID=3347168 RepID=UPI0035D75B33
MLFAQVVDGVNDPLTGAPNSAYQVLYKNIGDCDAFAQAKSAFYDYAGYTNMIVAGHNHAEMYLKLNNSWFLVTAGTFEKVNITTVINSGNYVLTNPTYGSYK